MGQHEHEDTETRPDMPTPGDDEDELMRRCTDLEERQHMAPKETADCAGAKTKDLFMENEEPGGA